MSLSVRETLAFGSTCREWLDKFAERFPHEEFHRTAIRSLGGLLTYRDDFPGDPAGWAGGIVYIMAAHDSLGMHPRFLNRELEDFFGVSMSNIRKCGDQIWTWSGEDGFDILPWRPRDADVATG